MFMNGFSGTNTAAVLRAAAAWCACIMIATQLTALAVAAAHDDWYWKTTTTPATSVSAPITPGAPTAAQQQQPHFIVSATKSVPAATAKP
jgi:hypothetical protein